MSAARWVFLLCLIAEVACKGPLDPVASSHIDANIPDQNEFQPILRRDLETFFRFTTDHDGVRVEYEFLRDGPTQTGTSYPRFYLWVKALDGNTVVTQGAVRVAAIDKVRFDVTDFVSREDVNRSPRDLQAVFPSALIDKILENAHTK